MNSYEKKANEKKTSEWLHNIQNSASDRNLPMGQRIKKGAGQAAIKLIAGIGGGFAGAAMGRWSILTGILATGAGEIMGSHEVTSFGVGMMASNLIPSGDSTVGATDDKKSGMEKMKDRVKSYGKGIMQKVWLDKIVKKKEPEKTNTTTNTSTTTEQTTNGMGEVKYYTHTQNEPDPMDMHELEKYENEIKRSGENFAQEKTETVSSTPEKENMETENENVSGKDDEEILGVEEERIY